MVYACVPGAGPGKYKDLSQGNLWDCFENIGKNIETFQREFIPNPDDPAQKQQLDEYKQLADEAKGSMDAVNKYKPFINFVESKYQCSGMCSSALFYLTVDVTNGPPEQDQGCLYPFAKDFGSIFANLGNTLIASGVFFLFMLILVFPLCCYKNDEDGPRATYSNLEGGEQETEQTRNQYLLDTNKVCDE